MRHDRALYHVSAAALAVTLLAAGLVLLTWGSSWTGTRYALVALSFGIVLGVPSLLLGLRESDTDRDPGDADGIRSDDGQFDR